MFGSSSLSPYPIPRSVPDPEISDRSVGSEEENLISNQQTVPPGSETTTFDSNFDSPTDRSPGAERAAFENLDACTTEQLRDRIFVEIKAENFAEVKRIQALLQRRAVERRAAVELEREARQRDAERVDAEAVERGGVCDLTAQGCDCAGRLDYRHQRFVDELRRPRITPETQAAIAELLGYPPKGARMRSIFGGTFGNGPAVDGFQWALGALEEDWLWVLHMAERTPKNGGPRRNAHDGSVTEGWVRAVLQNEIARHRATKTKEVDDMHEERRRQPATSGSVSH